MPDPTLLHSVLELTEDDWLNLETGGDPFVSRAFLGAAEACVTERGPLGWVPMHLLMRGADGAIDSFLPLYARHHWYGDFAADYSWHAAWQQLSLPYFPKLVTGVPFTPSPGPRLLLGKKTHPDKAIELIAAAIEMTKAFGASSWQCLFVRDHERVALESAGLLLRRGVQFHWRNRDYRDFADFLESFTTDKRKKMKRERRSVNDAGLRIECRYGNEIDESLWQDIHRHYCSTFERLGGYAAFSLDFFRSVGKALGRHMVIFCAFEGEKAVASAICYQDDSVLYGRHWGTDINCPGLHFELCYHAGIEYAINQGLLRFEPGAQGEHKIARGFEPVSTWSAFWIADERLRESVARYLNREDEAVLGYQAEMTDHLPYRD
jgi:predicted N-acyltransferase